MVDLKSMTPIQVVIADDHEIYRRGLKQVLGLCGIEVIGEASNGKILTEMIVELNPDVIISDLNMPVMGGLQALKEIIKNRPRSRSIILSFTDNESILLDAMEVGVLGFVTKSADHTELLEAIQKAFKFETFYSKTMQQKLEILFSRCHFNPYEIVKFNQLFSEKEKEVIKLICEEKSSREIGVILHMSARTVEGYKLKLIEKMNVKSTTGIVIYAVKNGMCL